MRNIRVSEKYQFLFLGGKPKTKYGTTDQAQDSQGKNLYAISAVMIDPQGAESPQPITVTLPQAPGNLGVGARLVFVGLTVSLYRLDSGRSGLSWRAAGFRENQPLPALPGGKNA